MNIRTDNTTMKHLVTVEEFMEAVESDRLVVIDFYAQWCGPCKAIAPILEKMAEEYEDKVLFYKVDVENAAPEIVVEIKAMPTFIFYRRGDQLSMFEGANPNRIRQTIEEDINDSELPESNESPDEGDN